ncbi:MAG: EAL domain-containing protein [Acidimicrobiales bacterium]
MVQEEELSEVLSDFARTLITDFPIQGILDHLVARIVDVLPVTAAGVTLITEGMAPRYVAASDESALRYERLQTESTQGPCISAFNSGEAVSVPDLCEDVRFPEFAAAAAAAGLAAVFTFPLRHGEGRLGALDLYRDTPGALEPHDMHVAQTLADVAAAYLLNAQARDDAREASDEYQHNALHDPLTGLPNRALLLERLHHAAQRARRSHRNAAILFADLDKFKQVNDNHGHQIGDELLIAVAHRLSGLVRPGDTLARVSGDEFVFLCEDLNSAADVEVLGKRIDESFATPFALDGIELVVTASVGMAFAGPGEDISEDLLRQADVAMYEAKRKGGAGHHILDLRSAVETSERHSLERDLRAAFDRGLLEIAYQPIVQSADGLVTGVEALLRWADPERGAVPTASVVELAEKVGLMTDIGAWVLERGCADRAQWLHDSPAAALDLSVNISSRQLMGPGFCETVAGVLTRTAMDPTALVLEMTEHMLIDDIGRAMSVLADLHELGIRVAVDDFGTGYSSLSSLRRLPINIVKIDQSVIADLGRVSTAGAIVAAVTDVAHAFGLTVTAEGVETQRQHDQVSAIGIEFAQGYFYARPMAASAIRAELWAVPSGALRLPITGAMAAPNRPSHAVASKAPTSLGAARPGRA